jgi:uncharacterized protein YdiU (UPF0061 family)
MMFNFDNSYVRLPKQLYAEVDPVAVEYPELYLYNHNLAENLGIQGEDETSLPLFLSGNKLPDGAKPIAQAYAGHQFGHFTMLGDGRAILLGEHLDGEGDRWDIQLKGSGRNPFSRGGDGRATLSAMLREYIISEGMAGLGIPTSRSLAVVTSGEKVIRESIHDGAILTRIASSHIRVGTFEYITRLRGGEGLDALLDYAIQRHYPALVGSKQPALDFLTAVMDRQMALVTEWMRVGFIHGVMNTDNTGIAGETFDYGPCAFMNRFDPKTVYSSIDTQGRYAYQNQPGILQWNMACLASALIPLIDEDQDQALAKVKAVVDTFTTKYPEIWLQMMGRKLGILDVQSSDRALVQSLLQWMYDHEADYTTTFLVLEGVLPDEGQYRGSKFTDWVRIWKERIGAEQGLSAESLQSMQTHNPVIIPRNYWVEQILFDATAKKDRRLLEETLPLLARPYDRQLVHHPLAVPKVDHDAGYKTFCGT